MRALREPRLKPDLNVKVYKIVVASDKELKSITLQKGVCVKRRHDTIKMVLAELARSCGYHRRSRASLPGNGRDAIGSGELESECPMRRDPPLIHGDLLLVRHNVHQLIDVTVVRPALELTFSASRRRDSNGEEEARRL